MRQVMGIRTLLLVMVLIVPEYERQAPPTNGEFAAEAFSFT